MKRTKRANYNKVDRIRFLTALKLQDIFIPDNMYVSFVYRKNFCNLMVSQFPFQNFTLLSAYLRIISGPL